MFGVKMDNRPERTLKCTLYKLMALSCVSSSELHSILNVPISILLRGWVAKGGPRRNKAGRAKARQRWAGSGRRLDHTVWIDGALVESRKTPSPPSVYVEQSTPVDAKLWACHVLWNSLVICHITWHVAKTPSASFHVVGPKLVGHIYLNCKYFTIEQN